MIPGLIFLTFGVIFFTGCIPDIAEPDSNSQVGSITDTPPSFSGSEVTIEDINGEDFYPGDEAKVTIFLKNSGDSTAENIMVKLGSDGLIDIPGESEVMEINTIMPGETQVLETFVRITGDIEEDSQGYIDFSVYAGGTGLFKGYAGVDILGVQEYTRNFIPIIGLHAIEEKIEIPIELNTTNFDILCKTLADLGYQTVTFADLLKHMDHGRALPDKAVIITSDDGYQGNYTNAFPVLKKYGYGMTVFLVTGAIAEDDVDRMENTVFNKRTDVERPMLIWPEIKEMDEYGCEFLSHTVNHIRLGLASDEEMLDELIGSREDIESRLGRDVDFFAWPYDNYSEDKWPLIGEAGYRGAVRYWGGIEDLRTIDLNNIKRFEFNSYVSPVEYAGYLGLLDISIENSIERAEISVGEELEIEYIINNNEDTDMDISSIELEIPKELELISVMEDGYISQFPALNEGIFMWVGGHYSIEAQSSINVKLIFKTLQSGDADILFRITTHGSYIDAKDLQLVIINE
ncbi:polysaccharide deacetylase family protein [Actinomycetota bacterium]